MARLEALRLPRRQARASRGWQWLRWAILGVATVAVTVVASMPATWMADRIATETGRRVLLADAAGTLWHGSATLALSAGTGSQTATVLPGRLTWDVAFWPMLAGTLRIVLEQDMAMAAPVTVAATPAGWTVQPGSIRLPASLLEGIGAPFNTLRPDGTMRVDWSALQGKFAGNQKFGHLTLQLDQMSAAVSRLRPLGSYRAEVDLTGADGKLQLSTTAGPLHLEGSGTLGRQSRFEGTAHADPEAATQLAGLLSLLGRTENNVTRLRF
ncbi:MULTISPECIES: type II secretion system protein N [Cupriavidus]|uniref:Type II secretion system protein N n=1 Tax=Cupriavidus pauculus TaxID=82633 RepID=A0A3G8GY59_9BURK|nr:MULTISPECIES: type II secretion system protein N [Cupriavidus]AZG13107.1 type II secretion system protein N [Cupriavidus pauculus]MDT6962100.1 type II secretion system protein N [Cupriavidus sp. SZY C1]